MKWSFLLRNIFKACLLFLKTKLRKKYKSWLLLFKCLSHFSLLLYSFCYHTRIRWYNLLRLLQQLDYKVFEYNDYICDLEWALLALLSAKFKLLFLIYTSPPYIRIPKYETPELWKEETGKKQTNKQKMSKWGTATTIFIIKMRGSICWNRHYAKRVTYFISCNPHNILKA